MGTELSLRIARLFEIDVDRKKWIDDTIDYFGTGRIDARRDPCGESLLAEMEIQ